MLPISRKHAALFPPDLAEIREIASIPYKPSPTIAIAQNLLQWNFTVFNSELFKITTDLTALHLYLMMVPQERKGLSHWQHVEARERLEKLKIYYDGPYFGTVDSALQFSLIGKIPKIQKSVLEVLEHGQEIGLTPQQRVRFCLMLLKCSREPFLMKKALYELHGQDLCSFIDPHALLATVKNLILITKSERNVLYHPFLLCHKLPMGDKAAEYRDLLLGTLPKEDINELISLLPLLDIPEENALALQNEPVLRSTCRWSHRY